MIKIKYLPTGNIFLLPDEEAEELKTKSPDDYKILEKNGKKFNDKTKPVSKKTDKSILELVLDDSPEITPKRRRKK